MVNNSVLITCIIPKNRSPIPVILKSSMIMLPPEPNYEDFQVNGFYKKMTIGDLFDKCNNIKKIAIYNDIVTSLECKDENPLQQSFGAESIAKTEDEPSIEQLDDLGHSPNEESCEWEEEDDYEDEEDDE